MRTILALAVALLMIAVAMPTASANESVSHDYIGGGFLAGLSCHEFCLGEDNPTPGTSLGGGRLYTSGAVYSNVIVSVSDDVFGQDAGSSVCFWNPDGDNICDGDDYRAGQGCGVRALTDSPFAGDYATVFIYLLVVTDDLGVCGASQGTITGNFF